MSKHHELCASNWDNRCNCPAEEQQSCNHTLGVKSTLVYRGLTVEGCDDWSCKSCGAILTPQEASSKEQPTSKPLVQRLRVWTCNGHEFGRDFECPICAAKEAADEIERLRAERDDAEKLAESLQNKWANRPLDHPSGEALIAENERLRAALQATLPVIEDYSALHLQVQEALRAADEPSMTLTQEDAKAFMAALENPPAPTEKLREAAARYVEPFDWRRFEKAPCFLCGYNGEGYYNSQMHPCAEKYHAALAAVKGAP